MARYNFLVVGAEDYPDIPKYPEQIKFWCWDSYFEENECDTMEVSDGMEGILYTVYKPKNWVNFIEYLESEKIKSRDYGVYDWMDVYIDLAKWCNGKEIYWGIGDGC